MAAAVPMHGGLTLIIGRAEIHNGKKLCSCSYDVDKWFFKQLDHLL